MLDNIYPLLHLYMKWNEKQMKLKDIKFNTIKQNHFEKTIKGSFFDFINSICDKIFFPLIAFLL